jgi:alpha-glucosidase (family GH31 glycosyl hydrolase)
VEIDKKDYRLRVLRDDGRVLMEEASPVKQTGGLIEAERIAPADEKFFGLGARTGRQADARGLIVESATPFLISTKGYGLHHTASGRYFFDVAATTADRCHIALLGGRRFEYYFYYGPRPKDVYEEHMGVVPPQGYARFSLLSRLELPRRAHLLPDGETPSWTSLEGAVRSLTHVSLSGILNPAFDAGSYATASELLYRRALQFASVVPLVLDSHIGALDESRQAVLDAAAASRARFVPFLLPYVEETNSRGYPMIHPLAMQFPSDTQGADLTDEFMVGDEILVAPIYTEDGRRSVYLPMGRWTELSSNKEYDGRQTLMIQAAPDVLPLFLKNGSIVPVAGPRREDPLVAHYLPRLGAEFFLYEPEVADYTQLHAAPVLDLMRLEVNAKVERSYEWVVHHTAKPSSVTTNGQRSGEVPEGRLLRAGAWFYDAPRKNLHIVVAVPAGQTAITNLTF